MGGLRTFILAVAAIVVMAAAGSAAKALEVSESITLKAGPDKVWSVINSFGGLHQWHPWFVSTTLHSQPDGLHRTIMIGDGTWFYEKLEDYSRSDRSLSYSIVDTPVPIKNYLSTIKVTPAGDGSKVTWSSTFDSAGMPDQDLANLISDAYKVGLQNISDMVGG